MNEKVTKVKMHLKLPGAEGIIYADVLSNVVFLLRPLRPVPVFSYLFLYYLVLENTCLVATSGNTGSIRLANSGKCAVGTLGYKWCSVW